MVFTDQQYLKYGLVNLDKGSVMVKNNLESSLVMEVNKNQDSDQNLLKLKKPVYNQKVEASS